MSETKELYEKIAKNSGIELSEEELDAVAGGMMIPRCEDTYVGKPQWGCGVTSIYDPDPVAAMHCEREWMK